eukprot:CAMPEP_0175044990 /NCGR_PEP_ID=MMETSP0052_2-20121109/4143_1 /TAXON_ID=51329 ORGANISM="Polytomella parva, Strain SAG 63-3" /NCGR_SAMPLE_ID=MMETSP0052_2 /ASSEMBLY_ACC=CAM_ASM_000194 /LENGTH=290 /DNA_ID=CAMNT_0016308409 /DNA_START=61 /DNA_END=930 /DNA_ORIENTATION=+
MKPVPSLFQDNPQYGRSIQVPLQQYTGYAPSSSFITSVPPPLVVQPSSRIVDENNEEIVDRSQLDLVKHMLVAAKRSSSVDNRSMRQVERSLGETVQKLRDQVERRSASRPNSPSISMRSSLNIFSSTGGVMDLNPILSGKAWERGGMYDKGEGEEREGYLHAVRGSQVDTGGTEESISNGGAASQNVSNGIISQLTHQSQSSSMNSPLREQPWARRNPQNYNQNKSNPSAKKDQPYSSTSVPYRTVGSIRLSSVLTRQAAPGAAVPKPGDSGSISDVTTPESQELMDLA